MKMWHFQKMGACFPFVYSLTYDDLVFHNTAWCLIVLVHLLALEVEHLSEKMPGS